MEYADTKNATAVIIVVAPLNALALTFQFPLRYESALGRESGRGMISRSVLPNGLLINHSLAENSLLNARLQSLK